MDIASKNRSPPALTISSDRRRRVSVMKNPGWTSHSSQIR
jgi:hypothetical protein